MSHNWSTQALRHPLHRDDKDTQSYPELCAKLSDTALSKLHEDLLLKHDAHRATTYAHNPSLTTLQAGKPVAGYIRQLFVCVRFEMLKRCPNVAAMHDEKITSGGARELREQPPERRVVYEPVNHTAQKLQSTYRPSAYVAPDDPNRPAFKEWT